MPDPTSFEVFVDGGAAASTDANVTAVLTKATYSRGQYFGSAVVKAIAYNANTISENITVTAGNNGISAGPITISDGYTVTLETDSVWTIV